MPLSEAERAWFAKVSETKAEEKKAVKARLEQHLVASGRAAAKSTLAANATDDDKEADAAQRETDRLAREDALQTLVTDKLEIAANTAFIVGGSGNEGGVIDLAPAAASVTPVQRAARQAVHNAAKLELPKKLKGTLDSIKGTTPGNALLAKAGAEVDAAHVGPALDPLTRAAKVEEQALKRLEARRNKAVADQLRMKDPTLAAYTPYNPAGDLVAPTIADPVLKAAVEKHVLDVEIDNQINDEIAALIAVEAPETMHAATRNEKIEDIINRVGVKYGSTNFAHLIGRHGAQRTNPATGDVTRTRDDMVGRLVAGVGADKKKVTMVDPTKANVGGTVTAQMVDSAGTVGAGDQVTVPEYTVVGKERAGNSSQHASAKAALYMTEESAAQVARLERQMEVNARGQRMGDAANVVTKIDQEVIDGQNFGAFDEPGKYGTGYDVVAPGVAIPKAGKAIPNPAVTLENRIKHTKVTKDITKARVTVLIDKLHGGVNPMTMFPEAAVVSASTTASAGANNVLNEKTALAARHNKQALAHAARVTALTDPVNGPKAKAKADADAAEVKRAAALLDADNAIAAQLPPAKKQAAEDARDAAVAAARAEAACAAVDEKLKKSEALVKSLEGDDTDREDAATEASAQLAKALVDAEAALTALNLKLVNAQALVDPAKLAHEADLASKPKKETFENAKDHVARLEARAAEAKVEVERIKADKTLADQNLLAPAADPKVLAAAKAKVLKLTDDLAAAAKEAMEKADARDVKVTDMADGVAGPIADAVKAKLKTLADETVATDAEQEMSRKVAARTDRAVVDARNSQEAAEHARQIADVGRRTAEAAARTAQAAALKTELNNAVVGAVGNPAKLVELDKAANVQATHIQNFEVAAAAAKTTRDETIKSLADDVQAKKDADAAATQRYKDHIAASIQAANKLKADVAAAAKRVEDASAEVDRLKELGRKATSSTDHSGQSARDRLHVKANLPKAVEALTAATKEHAAVALAAQNAPAFDPAARKALADAMNLAKAEAKKAAKTEAQVKILKQQADDRDAVEAAQVQRARAELEGRTAQLKLDHNLTATPKERLQAELKVLEAKVAAHEAERAEAVPAFRDADKTFTAFDKRLNDLTNKINVLTAEKGVLDGQPQPLVLADGKRLDKLNTLIPRKQATLVKLTAAHARVKAARDAAKTAKDNAENDKLAAENLVNQKKQAIAAIV